MLDKIRGWFSIRKPILFHVDSENANHVIFDKVVTFRTNDELEMLLDINNESIKIAKMFKKTFPLKDVIK